MRRTEGHRAGWILAGLAVVLVAALIVAAALEHTEPVSALPPNPWTESTSTPTTPPASLAPSAAALAYVFPVAGKATYARDHHDYPASDIIAACGLAFRAPTSGVVLELSRSDTYDAQADDGGKRGGLYVSLAGDDGVRYYGSHLRTIPPDIVPGARVKAGAKLGEVGDTGDASVCHLHFGISPLCAERGDWWIRRGVIWPWSYLDSWRTSRPRSPAAEIAKWQGSHGCPGAP
jgi:murein DD-endopeptidase MepM/ murein hydrolase activator NlpD